MWLGWVSEGREGREGWPGSGRCCRLPAPSEELACVLRAVETRQSLEQGGDVVRPALEGPLSRDMRMDCRGEPAAGSC